MSRSRNIESLTRDELIRAVLALQQEIYRLRQIEKTARILVSPDDPVSIGYMIAVGSVDQEINPLDDLRALVCRDYH